MHQTRLALTFGTSFPTGGLTFPGLEWVDGPDFQDLELRTVTEKATFANPYFEIVSAEGLDVQPGVRVFEMSGVLTDKGTWESVHFDGVLDLRRMTMDDPRVYCDALEQPTDAFGDPAVTTGTCERCDDGVQACLPVRWHDGVADLAEFELVDVD